MNLSQITEYNFCLNHTLKVHNKSSDSQFSSVVPALGSERQSSNIGTGKLCVM